MDPCKKQKAFYDELNTIATVLIHQIINNIKNIKPNMRE